MDARFVRCDSVSRCRTAVCSSARIRPVLDAAILLVVSLCVVILRIMMQFG
ncbi:MAG: hypothetical protein IJN67_14465 [Oscillospiraceae bacterium]|nr:hypothetical protein [Oscillospiraceae bacterium]